MHSENLRYTPRVNHNVKNGLWVIVFINYNCYITVGRLCMCGTGVCGTSLYFPVNFAVNLKLLYKKKKLIT